MQVGRFEDGSAGDVDYGAIGQAYARFRQQDPTIAQAIRDALGDVRTVINVGAGTGSYEPADLEVTAVEPSATMRAQRPTHLSPAVDAVAERLPFPDASFDAAMATFTVHQWSSLEQGLAEMQRVARGPIVIMLADPDQLHGFWLNDYLPEVLDVEAERYPQPAHVLKLLGPTAMVRSLPVPRDCTDGFAEGYFGRPERFLEPGVRGAMSSFSLVAQEAIDRFLAHLGGDLASGEWDRNYGHLREAEAFDGSLRLVIRSGNASHGRNPAESSRVRQHT